MPDRATRIIEIVLNGEPREAPEGASLLNLLDSLGLDPSRVAIELDRRIIRKPDWGATRLEAGSRVEIVQFVGGG
jgi:sulfur carrier protein